ncbi:MAG: hypothetical protein ABL983_13820, partial [Nitrospira sp.]
TARLAVLQANAHTRQRQTKRLRREHRLVIRAQHTRAAILTTGGDEIVPDRPRRLVPQPLDTQAGPAGMVHDGQHDMPATLRIRLGQQIHPPDEIAWHRTWHAMFQCSSPTQDGMLLSSDRVGDVGFADGHLPTDREAPVEGVHDRAAACMGHKGFEPNDFVSHPTRFASRKRDRLLFQGSAGPSAWAQRGGEAEQGGDPRLPVRRPEGLLAIHAGA